jgi:hypothetical protein
MEVTLTKTIPLALLYESSTISEMKDNVVTAIAKIPFPQQ